MDETKEGKSKKTSRKWAILIGVGMALTPIHNVRLTELVTEDGVVGFFIPSFGVAIWLMGTLLCITHNWHRANWKDWGDKRVFTPLIVIVGAIGLSGITADTWMTRFAPLLMGVTLFATYLVARVLGKTIFLPLAIGAVIASLGVIVYGIQYLGATTGGYVFDTNYDIVTGFVLLGVALFAHKWQKPLISLALVAMFLSGSLEAVFAIGVLGLVVLLRRDWSKKMIVVLLPVVLIASVWFTLGYGQELYGLEHHVKKDFILNPLPEKWTPRLPPAEQAPPDKQPPSTETPPAERGRPISYETTLARRWSRIEVALTNLRPLGEGYSITRFKGNTIHNVPLVLVQQLGWPGMLAGLAWLWVSVWCLVKTRWKYVWVMVLALSVWDHFIWTQMCPFWPAIIGMTTTSDLTTDLIFQQQLKKQLGET